VLTLHHRSQGSGLLEKREPDSQELNRTANGLSDGDFRGSISAGQTMQQRNGRIAIPSRRARQTDVFRL
ncbi:MAG TPA: hypothetical protein VHW66_22385, partial [Stellaceae bacterium]|nr:hypothetical protein [Stellaceae bacterium]